MENNRITDLINSFVQGNSVEITISLEELYPKIKRKEWLDKTLITCKEIIQMINFKHLKINFNCTVVINSTGTRCPAPKSFNNRIISFSFDQPVFLLTKADPIISDNYKYDCALSGITGTEVYYSQKYFAPWDIYLRELHLCYDYRQVINVQ